MSLAGRRFGRLTVWFANTCGSRARAFYEHPSAAGNVTELGATVIGRRVSSSLTSDDAAFCRYGYEVKVRRGWREMTLNSHGRC